MPDIEFSPQAQKAIDLIENTSKHLFITGKAGTGKSTLLEHVRLYAKKKIIVLAPTGVSAINVNGETIHSFFGLKPGFEKQEAKKMKIDEKKRKKFGTLTTIAIDEISMVRADLLDAIDIVLRRARQEQAAFGGVQMIFFGDLYQLPPVITKEDYDRFYSEYTAPYFFAAQVFRGQTDLFGERKFELETIELTDIYRQNDTTFINVLNAVRNGEVTGEHLDILNTRLDTMFDPPRDENYIFLMTTNANANRINMQRLKELPRNEKKFGKIETGKVPRSLVPNDAEITLKIGAQVMFIQNDSERRWVNGTIGRVHDIREATNKETKKKEPAIMVELENGKMVEVRPYTWEISRYTFIDGEFQRDIMGTYTQLPLRLAWAITIHKSQGKTFEKVVIDFGRGTFVHGQTYVALSRCTSLEGIVLRQPFTRNSIIMDDIVRYFNS